MEIWPDDYEGAWTLAGVVSREGVGLHTGESCEVRLAPSSSAGYHLSWLNQDLPPIRLSVSQVRHSLLCTTLQVGDQYCQWQ